MILVFIILGIIGSAGSDKGQKVSNSSSGSTKTDVSASQATTTSSDNQTYKVGDSIKLGGAVVTVNKMETSNGGQFSKPQTGNQWVNLNVTIENTEANQQFVTTMGQMFLRDGDGNSYQVAVTDRMMESVNNSLDGAIIAKSKKTGWVGFEVKKDAKNLQFQYNGSMWGGNNITVNLQ